MARRRRRIAADAELSFRVDLECGLENTKSVAGYRRYSGPNTLIWRNDVLVCC